MTKLEKKYTTINKHLNLPMHRSIGFKHMKKINAGYYKGIYKGIEFEIIKLQDIKENLWYWKIGDKDVEDHYSTKYVAILAVKEYIDEI